VSGALARQAEKALSEAIAAGGRSGNDVVEELLRLVAVDELGRPTRRRVRRSDLPAHAEAEFAPFIDLGLLTTDRENDAVVVGVSHEAFLKKWPPLAEAIADNTESLRAAGMVERDAELWCANGRPADGLWDGRQLAGAVAATGARLQRGTASRRPWRRRTLVTDRVELGTSAREFLRAGIRRDRRRRRRATTVLSVLLVVALTAAGVAYVQWQAVEDRQRLATARLLAGQADALLPRDPRTALQLGEAAAQLNPSVETRSALARNLLLLSDDRDAHVHCGLGQLGAAACAVARGAVVARLRDPGHLDGHAVSGGRRDHGVPARDEGAGIAGVAALRYQTPSFGAMEIRRDYSVKVGSFTDL